MQAKKQASLQEDTESTWEKNRIGSAGTEMSMRMAGGWFCISSKQTLF